MINLLAFEALCLVFLLLVAAEGYRLPPGSSAFERRWRSKEKFDTRYGHQKESKLSMSEEQAWEQIDFGMINATIAEWSKPMPVEYINMPLVIAGPSGVGKNRLIRALLKDYSRFFKRVTTHTTRKPRVDEVHGQDYYFVNKENFLHLNSTDPDFFLETAYVHNNIYGTSRESFLNIMHKENRIPILEIDVQGVQTIRALAPTLGLRPKYLFIAPESTERLRERLILRCTERSEEIDLRLSNAVHEIKLGTSEGLFDDVLINSNFSEATNALFRIVRKWYPSMPNAGRIRALQRKMRNLKDCLRRQRQENLQQ